MTFNEQSESGDEVTSQTLNVKIVVNDEISPLLFGEGLN